MSLEILTEGSLKNLPWLPDKIDGIPARFISGYVHDGGLSPKQFEVVFQVPWSRHMEIFTNLLRIFDTNFLEEIYGGELYTVKSMPIDTRGQDFDYYIREDLRYMLFGSRKILKAFLQTLDQQMLQGNITEEQYICVMRDVDTKFSQMWGDYKNAWVFHRNQVKREWYKIMESDALVRPYLKMALEYLAMPKQ